ncbi:MAG: NUDIX domain-containing protein [Patescibacteria group bacterium]|jgi:8-oxo-dGTP pyrophosphatase MutT (NUDIX family)
MSSKLEFSAGGIVFKKTKAGVKIALILDPFHKWTFAKGHVEEGERVERAALREVAEETGMYGLKLSEKLGEMDYWFKADSKGKPGGKDLIHKVVYWYLMEAPEDVNIELQDAEGIAELKWVTVDELSRIESYKNMQVIIDKAVEVLKAS